MEFFWLLGVSLVLSTLIYYSCCNHPTSFPSPSDLSRAMLLNIDSLLPRRNQDYPFHCHAFGTKCPWTSATLALWEVPGVGWHGGALGKLQQFSRISYLPAFCSSCSHLITNSVILTWCAGWCYLPCLGVKWIHYKSLKCIDHVICFLFLLSVQGKKRTQAKMSQKMGCC